MAGFWTGTFENRQGRGKICLLGGWMVEGIEFFFLQSRLKSNPLKKTFLWKIDIFAGATEE